LEVIVAQRRLALSRKVSCSLSSTINKQQNGGKYMAEIQTKDADMTKVDVDQQKLETYWKENRSLVFTMLGIWFAVSYLIQFFSGTINSIVIAGFPLGYYMGSQGALIVFVVMIFVYAKKMNDLDKKYNLEEEGE
jgi:putative solute:sodium symporter small subunit